MSLENRMKNLYLLRFFYETMGSVAKELNGIANESALIRMGQGKKEVSDATARSIESRLGLPEGWMDRDNEKILRMSPTDHQLLLRAALLPEAKKRALIEFLP